MVAALSPEHLDRARQRRAEDTSAMRRQATCLTSQTVFDDRGDGSCTVSQYMMFRAVVAKRNVSRGTTVGLPFAWDGPLCERVSGALERLSGRLFRTPNMCCPAPFCCWGSYDPPTDVGQHGTPARSLVCPSAGEAADAFASYRRRTWRCNQAIGDATLQGHAEASDYDGHRHGGVVAWKARISEDDA